MSEAPEKIRVVVFEPGKPGEVRDIDNDLKAMQAIVGGYIEIVRLHWLPRDRALSAVCNEEGLLRGLPPNRAGLVGPFFVVREEPPEFVSLTDADVALVQAHPDLGDQPPRGKR